VLHDEIVWCLVYSQLAAWLRVLRVTPHNLKPWKVRKCAEQNSQPLISSLELEAFPKG